MRPVTRRLAALLLAGFPLIALCADYVVEPVPELRMARVTLTVSSPSTEFRMPAWAPGDYEIFNYGNRLSEVKFFLRGQEVAGKKSTDPNAWIIEGGADKVEYLVNESRGNFSPNLRVTEAEMFVSGPGVLGWFVGHANEKHRLHLDPEPDQNIAIALPEDPNKPATPPNRHTYLAPDYDVLIDSPFVVSRSLRTKDFVVAGKPHTVAAFNQSQFADLDAYAAICTKVIESSNSLFRELPYDRYVFLFDFGGPGGGLEHLNCTRIGLGSRTTAGQASGIIFHEYFHAFNVKRIRSEPLGPFDYTRPAMTGAIWWLEGVTDYYADVLAVRSGVDTRASFLQNMAGTFNGLHRGTAFTRVSADECSKRVWEVRGSQGYGGMSYYTKGKVVGLALDLAIRGHSGGKHSLDDVIRDLYNECKGPKGFSETRIRELCIKYGGDRLADIYDACVMQAVRVPIEPIQSVAGFVPGDGVSQIAFVPSESQAKSIADQWPLPTKN